MKDFFIGVFSKIKAIHVAFFILLLLSALFGVYLSLSTNPANKKVSALPFLADTTIVPTKGTYAYENKTNSFRSQFKEKPTASNSIVFSNNLGNISFFTPAKQSFGTINSNNPPKTDGSIITYPEIFPSVDLKYTISSTRLLEEFIVKDAATATSIDRIEQIATTKSTYVENEDGSITFSNKDKVVFTLPHPVMYEINNQESKSDGIVYEIKEDKNQLIITKVITDDGKAWLTDPKRVYPIAIDLVIDNADALSSATVIDNADALSETTAIDNADTSANWTSSDATNTTVSQETTIKQEGSGSVKTQTTAGGAPVNVDLMEYISDGTAQTAYVTNATGVDDSYSKVLLHMNGTDASTTFTDEGGKTWTRYGNAQIDTAQSKFGGASGLFDGTGDVITTPDHADFAFGTGAFTIDFWIRFNVIPTTTAFILNQRFDASNQIQLIYDGSQWRFVDVAVGISSAQNSTLSINTWYHMAIVRTENDFKWFQNGVQLGTTVTNAASMSNIASEVVLGGFAGAYSSQNVNGWIDEFRVSKGIARWTSNFTPPTSPYISLQAYNSDTNGTGGTITTSGGNTIHTFTESGTFTPNGSGNVEYLVVGGGGGGGGSSGGGGGAGGFLTATGFAVTPQGYTVTVGSGGAGGTAPNNRGTSGSNSVFSTITATGGGGGGADAIYSGISGGSGGGSYYGGAIGNGTGGQGNNGGLGTTSPNNYGSGGGGGASAVGGNGTSTVGGNGGAGTASSISGSSVTYAGGGGGASQSGGTPGTGGAGGGGNAGISPTAGTANTGGGGGGGSYNAGYYPGAAGGSGIVIVSYPTPSAIKSEGSYSLKGVAVITASLNKTLTRTIASPLNLSGQNSVTFDIRASRTGSNIKIGLHDVGGITTEVTPNITQANTFQSATIDLSGVTNANKDAIDQIIITVVNADAANTFYLDNMVANVSSSLNDTITRTTTATNLSAVANITYWVRSSVAGSYATFGFGEAAATEQTQAITINQANTWEQKSWDISGISSASRNAVTKFAFTFTANTSGASFYFDDIRSAISTWTSSDATNSTVSQETTIKQEGTGSVKTQTTAGAGSTTVDLFEFASDGAAQAPTIVSSVTATGGTITYSGGYTIHTFTSSGTFTPTGSGNVEYLVVGGGGGGGGGLGSNYSGGGGGAGGFRTGTGYAVTSGSPITVTVGAGGAGSAGASIGVKGSDSIFGTITSTGGGYGGGGASAGGNGGSGGGGKYGGSAGSGNTPSTSPSQGNSGGAGNVGDPYGGGGGGGASAAGGGAGYTGNAGGAGTTSSISGESITYAGGGGAGKAYTGAAGGAGGGGTGGGSGQVGNPGTANLGGGGGGGGWDGSANLAGGAGGSGIVIVRYPSNYPSSGYVSSGGFSATGGTITTSGGYTIHTFTSSGTFTPNSSGTVEYLVIGGGGGGGSTSGYDGGGGAGGFRTGTGFAVTAQAYSVTVGGGGTGGTSEGIGDNGDNSVFSSITSAGGGSGGPYSGTNYGEPGGSGGGGVGSGWAGGAGNTPSTSPSQGNTGGTGGSNSSGGGGGAGAVGANGSTGVAGNGGAGTASSISGTSVTYAGGGGGGALTTAGSGGSGGGGNGATSGVGSNGTVNTGGGGGGGGGGLGTGGTGGSGIVIIRYPNPTPTLQAYNGSELGTGGTITSAAGYAIHTFTSSGTFTPATSGNVEALVVAGGGGAGTSLGGGGGGGGLIYNASYAVTVQGYSVTVGGGGAGGPATAGGVGTQGGNSVFGTLTAIGGGGGSGQTSGAATTGGSGGGSAAQNPGVPAAGTAGQGYAGGDGLSASGNYGGGGGGGAGAVGGNGGATAQGNGGVGKQYSQFSSVGGSPAGWFAGGGAGGDYVSGGTQGIGGSGGGGNGGTGGGPGSAGTANTGGGGGAGNYSSGYSIGGAGGSGIVIVRYLPSQAKSEGSYSLKGVAAITTSLNKTLTRTIASPLNLSDKSSVTFDIRASRTGSNIKVGIHDVGGTTTEVTPNITSADTFQSATIDLSGVTNANKDAIDQIIITVINADATNTFYLDNMVAIVSSSLNDTITRTVSATDLSAATSLTYYVRSSVAGSYATFGFGESAATEQTNAITISQANTWEQKTWDISGIAAASRNAVTKFAFKFTGDTSGASFYFDDIQSVISPTWVSSDATNTTVSLETTIKQEGSGSVKVQTTAGTSYDTVTRSTSATDLSSVANITYWVRSSVAGSYATFGFGEAAATEQTQAITINQANTWEQKSWNIEGISAASRNAVTKFAFTFTGDTTGAAFYFDDIQTNNLFTPTLGTATSLSDTSIRWNFTDNSTEETGFKIYDSTGATVLATCASANLTYCDETGLTPNTQYTRKIGTYNASSTSITSGTVSEYTLAAIPSAPLVTNRTNTTVQVNPDPSTNAASTTMAIYKETGATCDGSGGSYIAANGSDNGATAVWQTDAAWGTAGVVTVTGLDLENIYSFCVKAKNANAVETAFSSSGQNNSGYIPISGSYVFTSGTPLNSSAIVTRYQNRTTGGRYIFGVDNGTQDSDPNTAIFEVQNGILNINALDTLVTGSLRLTGGSVQMATSGGEIKIGEKLWAIDADVDGYTSDGKLQLGSKPTGGRRKGLVTTLAILDCGESTYSTTNVCCTVATRYQDSDGDTYGNPSVSISACTTAGYVDNNTDCNDTTNTIRTTNVTGGSITTSGSDKIHTFTGSGTLTVSCPASLSVQALVVGGGGGGGGSYTASAGVGGGGGGGRVIYNAAYAVSGNIAVTIGGGGEPGQCGNQGDGCPYANGGSGGGGGNSTFGSITAQGGGGGGHSSAAGGGSAGTGGGGGTYYGGGGSGTSGYSGGQGADCSTPCQGGGGGGGGGSASGPNGGIGYYSTISGSGVYYGGGGAGNGYTGNNGSPGAGGGAVGYVCSVYGSTGCHNGAGAAGNTGGGGSGGAGSERGWGGAGGSGKVIIRYANP